MVGRRGGRSQAPGVYTNSTKERFKFLHGSWTVQKPSWFVMQRLPDGSRERTVSSVCLMRYMMEPEEASS
jgi:hypothetical protein